MQLDRVITGSHWIRVLLTVGLIGAMTAGLALPANAVPAGAIPAVRSAVVTPIGGAIGPTATTLRYGQHLAAGGRIVSPEGFVSLRMQADGQLTIWAGGRQLWTSHTTGVHNYAQVQKNGYLQIYSRSGRLLWSRWIGGTGSVLYVQNNGNVVGKNAAKKVIWQTNTLAFELDAGSALLSGQALYGPGGEILRMGTDGNLALRRGSTIIWQTSTTGNKGARLALNGDGNLVLYSRSNRILWNSGTTKAGSKSRLMLRADGDLALLSANGVVRWESYTSRNPPTAAVYAARLLAMWGGTVTGLPGAKSDLLATSRGQTIRNSDSCGNTVRVDIRIVRFLWTVTSKYKIKINNIITGHGCDSAQHPKGRSTDLGGVWNLTTGAFTSFGGYWGRNDLTVDRDFAVYASNILPNGAGLGQSSCAGVSSARLRPGVQFFPDACNHQHIQVQPSR